MRSMIGGTRNRRGVRYRKQTKAREGGLPPSEKGGWEPWDHLGEKPRPESSTGGIGCIIATGGGPRTNSGKEEQEPQLSDLSRSDIEFNESLNPEVGTPS